MKALAVSPRATGQRYSCPMDSEKPIWPLPLTTRSQAARMVPLDPLIPGCGWSIADPYHLPIEAGIRAERERLRGKSWLVVLYERSLDYDGIWEEVRLDEAFDESPPALARAGVVLKERTDAVRALYPDWRVSRRHRRWPMLSMVAGQRVRPLQDFFMDDGVGWGNHHVHVAVLALPAEPIDKELIVAIGADQELRDHFSKVGGECE